MSGATSFTSVPIVDISGLRSPDRAERERVAAEIGAAAREVGFLYISGSGIDEALFGMSDAQFVAGECAEFCGLLHAYMPFTIRAMPRPEFEAWIAQQSAGSAAPASASP